MNRRQLIQLCSCLLLLSAGRTIALSQNITPQPQIELRRTDAPIEVLDSTRELDGLLGPVRQVKAEVAKVYPKDNQLVEQSRSLLEVTLYDASGRRVENKTYPLTGSRIGRETHEYDQQGHLIETIARNSRGRVLSKTLYRYEFDALGNWTKMVATVEAFESGRVKLEPFEVTYRTITYYPGDELAESAGAAAQEEKTADVAAPPAAETKQKSEVKPDAADLVSASADTSLEQTGSEAQKTIQPAGLNTNDELFQVGVINKRAVSLPRPAYPVSGQRASKPIIVVVEVVVEETGRVSSAHALHGPSALMMQSEEVARKAVFLPFKVKGVPIRVRGFLYYDFLFVPERP